MREHIRAFLLTSSLAFCIPTTLDLTEAQREQICQILHQARALSHTALTRAETLRRLAAVLSPEQRENLARFQSESKALRDFTLG